MKTKILYGIIGVVVLGVLVYAVWPNEPMVVENIQIEEELVSTSSKASSVVKKSTQTTTQTQPKTVYTVLYTKNGFEPSELQIPKGAKVRFVNKTSTSMRVFADETAKPPFTDLNQPKALGLNGEYEFNFVYGGVWSYFNSLKPADRGNIVVY